MNTSKKVLTVTHWLIFVITVFCIKYLILIIDPMPMFFLGDSASYINTALYGNIPSDRSFIYGFIIRFIAVTSHSLTSMVAFQIFISALASILCAYVLLNLFSVTPTIAFSLGLLCAIEPLQLMYERYILTETIALFLLVCYLILIFYYFKSHGLIFLILLQIIGIGLISIRLSFLPLYLGNGILLPLLAGLPLYRLQKTPSLARFGAFASHLAVSVGLMLFFTQGYKHLNGYLSNKPPAYQYQSGLFLLADWGPVVKPEDFPLHDFADTVFGKLKFDLKDRRTRGLQRWVPGGLISNIKEVVPAMLEAEHFANTTAINALKRDPLGIVMLAVSSFKDYWDIKYLKKCMQFDRGERALTDFDGLRLLEALRNNFSLSAEKLPFLKTFTNTYFYNAWPWYLFLLCLPLFAFILLFICGQEIRLPVFAVFFASLVVVAISCSLIERPTIRYLHSLGWLSFLIIGPYLDIILKKWRRGSKKIANEVI